MSFFVILFMKSIEFCDRHDFRAFVVFLAGNRMLIKDHSFQTLEENMVLHVTNCKENEKQLCVLTH